MTGLSTLTASGAIGSGVELIAVFAGGGVDAQERKKAGENKVNATTTDLKPLLVLLVKFGTILRLSYPLPNFGYRRPLAVH